MKAWLLLRESTTTAESGPTILTPRVLVGIFITKDTPAALRMAFRNSTESLKTELRIVFFVGKEGDFAAEQAQYGDIVQGAFPENMDGGKSYEWILWASKQNAEYVIKMDTDVSVEWGRLLAWIGDMKPPAYFGRINGFHNCGGLAYCPPPHCGDFSGNCWIYMSGGLYGFSSDVVKSISECNFSREHMSSIEDVQSGQWVRHCVSGVNTYHKDNSNIWCHKTNIEINHIASALVPSDCGNK